MYRVYIGNLDEQVDVEILESLFSKQDLPVSNLLVKRGYAFADCANQQILERTIDKLHGYNLMGATMQVEPSNRRRRNNRIIIKNVPSMASQEEVETLVATFGTVLSCQLMNNDKETNAQVTYENPDQAQQAVDQLNGYTYQESELRVSFARANGSPKGMRMGGGGGAGPAGGAQRNAMGGPANGLRASGSGYALKILVPSDFVGAIIGKGGETIRTITKKCNSRVDVHGKENSGLLEKVISIYGNPENCTSACKEILLVMQNELSSPNRTSSSVQEIVLKILADNRYCGRVIGREGRVIKKIREDTQTKITVSNDSDHLLELGHGHGLQDVASMFPERVISVRGDIDHMSEAEGAISTILRECAEKDMHQPQLDPRMMAMPGAMGGLPMMQGAGAGGIYPGGGPGFYPGMYPGVQQGHQDMGFPPSSGSNSPTETCQICVPNSAVGALIGAAGSNIKQIIRDSQAFVTIEPKKDDDPNPASERIVSIKGTQDSIWRASYYVFEKLKSEGFSGNDDVRLRTAIRVPQKAVGFVIGKGGKNVREVQRMTGAIIKLPEDQTVQGDEVVVEAYGTFMSVHSAHSRIRALAEKQRQQQMRGGAPGPGSDRGGPTQRPMRPPPPPAQPGAVPPPPVRIRDDGDCRLLQQPVIDSWSPPSPVPYEETARQQQQRQPMTDSVACLLH
ncbi:hypothetical protein CAPTEDRAFT_229004 [Capitella teleta]|uniref:RRM domain-containing protein n=1 Tax=Capitella teleta TaxID=283909 RepID=R7UQF3_CAPTE|nr:hypothetical protein CAPTEDRAFT_229004 [Capitella teleta]|eukprot:ELU05631.1 hypothetical protein CAPTEDRAFT_229004 [Capitella teleta]